MNVQVVRHSRHSASPGSRGPYLVGVGVRERRVVLAGAVGGPVLVHGGGGRGFVQQAALCGDRGRSRVSARLGAAATRPGKKVAAGSFTLRVSSGDPRVPQLRLRRRGGLGVT